MEKTEIDYLQNALKDVDGNSFSEKLLNAGVPAGPVRDMEEAINHPIWKMGKKISVDSSTLMNKGLELIEAKWLFESDTQEIEIIIHPEGIVHSLVEFKDNSIIAQMGNPDMKIPIAYGLGFPDRIFSNVGSLDLSELGP